MLVSDPLVLLQLRDQRIDRLLELHIQLTDVVISLAPELSKVRFEAAQRFALLTDYVRRPVVLRFSRYCVLLDLALQLLDLLLHAVHLFDRLRVSRKRMLTGSVK